MFFRRGVSDDDPWLTPKLWIFGAGAMLALAGMLLDNAWLMGAAGLVLLTGMALRFVPHPADRAAKDTGPEGAADPADGEGP